VFGVSGIASGSMISSGPPFYNRGSSGNSAGSGSNPPGGAGSNYEYGSGNQVGAGTPSGDFSGPAGPLSHLSESVNSLDPLNAMEKSLNEQVSKPLRGAFDTAKNHKRQRRRRQSVRRKVANAKVRIG